VFSMLRLPDFARKSLLISGSLDDPGIPGLLAQHQRANPKAYNSLDRINGFDARTQRKASFAHPILSPSF
jgi:hypothetical protein